MKEDARLSVAGIFSHAADAIEFVGRNPVDIAFLSIEMPELSGLELAERLSAESLYIEIVFITAYDKYAPKAFQVHAVGYLLKPLDSGAVKEQIDNLAQKLGHRREAASAGYLSVKCFGQYVCCAEELFALLIHYQAKPSQRRFLSTPYGSRQSPKRPRSISALPAPVSETRLRTKTLQIFCCATATAICPMLRGCAAICFCSRPLVSLSSGRFRKIILGHIKTGVVHIGRRKESVCIMVVRMALV